MGVQMKNFELKRIHSDNKRKKQSDKLLEKYLKSLDDLNVANEKNKTFEEELHTKLIIKLIIIDILFN